MVTALKFHKKNILGDKIPMYEVVDGNSGKGFTLTEEQFEKMFDVIEQTVQPKNPYFNTEDIDGCC